MGRGEAQNFFEEKVPHLKNLFDLGFSFIYARREIFEIDLVIATRSCRNLLRVGGSAEYIQKFKPLQVDHKTL